MNERCLNSSLLLLIKSNTTFLPFKDTHWLKHFVNPWPTLYLAPQYSIIMAGNIYWFLCTRLHAKPFIFYIFIWLCQILAAAGGIFSWGVWDLDPCPEIKSRTPALGAQSLSHWTTREGPRGRGLCILDVNFFHSRCTFLSSTTHSSKGNRKF